MPDESKKNFFISYNKADRSWAEWIAWQLESARYTTVSQAWDFRPGSNFVLEMDDATKKAERTIAVLSPDYLNALFTKPEWAAAFAQDPIGVKHTLIPVRVRDCDVEGLLAQIVHIDLVGKEALAARNELLAGMRERGKPDTPPAFPGTSRSPIADQPRFPGAWPEIWSVPHNRNPNFTGRDDYLSNLRRALTSGHPAALTQSLSGLGGVGKTQLAVEYANRYATEYDVVWWMVAEEPAALAADYARLASKLGLPEKDATEQIITIEAVRNWLGHHQNWLLIFDNAREPADLFDYPPPGNNGHVMVTSRNQNWGGVAQALTVAVLPRDKAVEFLLKRTGQTDEAAASALAEALGKLPLALEQAGAYMEATGRSLADYLGLFKKHGQQLLARGKPSTKYPATVATTWDISFQQVQAASPAGADLLNLCAYLAPDDIPLKIINDGKEHLPESLAAAVTDPLVFDEAVAALRRYSLVEKRGDTLSIHRLAQQVVRDRLAEDDRKRWVEAAVDLINSSFIFDPNNVQTWPVCMGLLPHALVVTEHAEALKLALVSTASLLNNVGRYLRVRADFAQAKTIYERAMTIGEIIYGSNHSEVAVYINNLGLILQELGDLQGAQANFQRALEIDEATYGPNHPNVSIYVNNLGDVLRELGDLQGAQANFQRALEIDEATYGPNHPKVAIRLSNLGGVLRELGDLQGAQANLQRALEIDEATYGPNHPDVAIDVNNLGGVLRELGDLQGARDKFQRALEISEETYGTNHPTVATRLSNLGSVLQDLGDLKGAKENFERALSIGKIIYGSDHPKIALRLSKLGGVLRALGDLDGARTHYEQALGIFMERLGENHPSAVRARKNLDALNT
jgi:tetratricopeptide (TPR) repeat protein